MGAYKHVAIVITMSDDAVAERDEHGDIRSRARNETAKPLHTHLHEQASELGLLVSPLVSSRVNNFVSFAVFPDGSKLGWDIAEAAQRGREAFIEECRRWVYSDGSSSVKWAEVVIEDDYADEGRECRVERSWESNQDPDPDADK